MTSIGCSDLDSCCSFAKPFLFLPMGKISQEEVIKKIKTKYMTIEEIIEGQTEYLYNSC